MACYGVNITFFVLQIVKSLFTVGNKSNFRMSMLLYMKSIDCYVCCHSTSSSSDCCSEWGQGEERRLRDHIGKLKTERSTVRGTVVELENCHAEPVVSRQPISLAEARKLDLETAVLMQV